MPPHICCSVQQVLLHEHGFTLEVEVDVGLLLEAVAFVLRQDIPHRRTSLADLLDNLLGFCGGHARIVGAYDGEE